MKRGKYSKENFMKAVYEYNNGSTSAEVTAKYNIPGSTIRHHKLNPALKIGGGRLSLLNLDNLLFASNTSFERMPLTKKENIL